MSDVFISYSSRDRDRAHELADALAARGLSVWWDREIVTGQAFDAAIEAELDRARWVVVLWSRHAVASEWVKNEAAAAAERGVLLPAQLDETRPPLEFRRRQTADLSSWRPGDDAHGGFQALCRAIDGVGDARAAATPAPRPAGPSAAAPTKAPATTTSNPPAPAAGRRSMVVGAGAVALGGLAIGVALLTGQRVPEAQTSATAQSPQGPPPQSPAGSSPASTDAALATGPAKASDSVVGAPAVGLADRVAGRYAGEIVSDSKGPSGRRLVVTVEKLDADTVMVRSPYPRIDGLRITLAEAMRSIISLDGDTSFVVDTDKLPMALSLTPRQELAFHGVRQ